MVLGGCGNLPQISIWGTIFQELWFLCSATLWGDLCTLQLVAWLAFGALQLQLSSGALSDGMHQSVPQP